MKAEDTVMSDKQIALVVYGEASEYSMRGGFFRDNKVANAQAELSFRAGIKEVVGWLIEHSPTMIVGADIANCAGNEMKERISYYPLIELLEWQAQLKKWGIDGK